MQSKSSVTYGRSRVRTLSFAVLLVSLFGPLAWADTIYQLNIIVNQLDAAALPPNMKKRQDEINEIFKQCDVHLKDQKAKISITISKVKEKQDPKDSTGSSIAPNGDVSKYNPTRKKLYELGAKEVKYGGYKIWIAKTHQPKANGSTLLGKPVSIIKQQSGINGDARTWAHEIGHGLGLDHENDSKNLMYKSRKKDDKATGKSLTKAQCQKMLKNLKKLNPSTTKTTAQKGEPKPKSAKTALLDEVSDQAPSTPTDLSSVAVAFFKDPMDPFSSFISVDIDINFPGDLPPDLDLRLFLDLDNNPTTGDSEGFDAHVLITPSEPVVLFILDPATGQPLEPIRLPPPVIDPLEDIIDGESPDDSRSERIGTSVGVEIPLLLVTDFLKGNLAQEIPTLLMVVDPITGEPLDLIQGFVNGPLPPDPDAMVVPDDIFPGDPVEISGEGLAPLAPFEVLIDDIIVGTGVADSQGNFQITVDTEMLPPGDLLIDVIDAEGNVVLGSIKVNEPSSPPGEGGDLLLFRDLARCIARPNGEGMAIAVKLLRNERGGATGDVTITDVQPAAGSDWQSFQLISGPGRTLRDGGVAVVVARGTCTGDNLALDIAFDDGTVLTASAGDAAPAPSTPQPLRVRAEQGLLWVTAGEPETRGLEVGVYDLVGRRVLKVQAQGSRLVAFLRDERGRPLANGVYLVEVKLRRADGTVVRELRKIVLMR